MAATHIALIRGINVGRAKRISMAELRTLVENLGYGNVRTLLNSGNIVFTSSRSAPGKAAELIEKALVAETGVSARVTVLSAAELATAIAENPLLDIAKEPSRLLVAVLRDPADRRKLESLLKQDWGRARWLSAAEWRTYGAPTAFSTARWPRPWAEPWATASPAATGRRC